MNLSYRLTPEADQDLVEIWQTGWRNWGIKQANRYLEKLEQNFLLLCDNPYCGKAQDDIRIGYRNFQSGRHVIFYRVQDKNIEIVRILHDRMNFIQHFF